MKYCFGDRVRLPVKIYHFSKACLVLLSALACWAAAGTSQADQVEMKNGDRYIGKVVSVNTNTVVFQNEVLGTVNLARDKVTSVSVGSTAPTNATVNVQATAPAALITNAPQSVSAALRQMGGSGTNIIKQVEQEILSGSPEAKAKFNEMVKELMTGKLTVSDIRVQARSAADQLRAAKRDLGDEAGYALDGYLAILESFLKESGDTVSTVPATPSKTLEKP